MVDPMHVGTHLSLCVWHPVVAGQCHGQQQQLDLLALPRLWHGGIRGLPVGVSVSVAGLGTPTECGVPRHVGSLHAHRVCTRDPSLVSPSWTRHVQCRIQAGRGQGWSPGRSGSGPRQEWQWSLPVAAPVLLRLFLGTHRCKGFARSCFLLRKIPVGKKKTLKHPLRSLLTHADPQHQFCWNQLMLGCAWRGLGCQSQPCG